ncbi:MAG: hypothetical protein WAL32_07160 [Terriglobales bacterium]
MPSAPSPEDKVAALREEMDSIHYANTLYWSQGTAHSREERAEYQRRLDRLDEIRKELARLRSA